MKTRRLVVSVVAVTATTALLPTLAQASTEAQRRAWARSPVTVQSHGLTHENVCPGEARYRRDNGRFVNAYGPNEGACQGIFIGFPVHREGRVVVKTPPEARELRIAAIRRSWSQRLDLRDGRACAEFVPGRWECRMPPPGGEGEAHLRIEYPGALSTRTFTYRGHPPDSH